MKCTFTINYKDKNGTNHSMKFENELALNDWILANQHILNDSDKLSAYSDIIFEVSPRAVETYDIIQKNNLKFKEILKQGHATITVGELENDIENYECHPPVLGVNRFLRSLEQSPGHPLFPVFSADDYWENKFKELEAGIFKSSKEKAEIKEILGREDVDSITSEVDKKIIRETYTKKWRDLGRNGNTTHKILLLYFSKDSKGKNVRDYTPDFINKYIKELLEAEINREPDKYAVIPETLIIDTITYAKSLEKDLKQRFGENAIFLPEITLVTGISRMELYDRTTKGKGSYDAIQGVLDLLVISEDGQPQIIDYKTSPHDYAADEYDPAKVKTFKYLLATYRRLLQRAGLNLNFSSGLFIAPIRYDDYRKGSDGNWTYDGITPYKEHKTATYATHLVDFTNEILSSYESEYSNESVTIAKNLDNVMPVPMTSQTTPKETLEYVLTCMASSFKQHKVGTDVTDEEVAEYIKDHKIDVKDKEGNYSYNSRYGKKIVKDPNLHVVIEEVKKDLQYQKQQLQKVTASYRREIEFARKHDEIKKRFDVRGVTLGSQEFLTNKLQKYLDANEWEFLGEDNPEKYEILDSLGILMFKNRVTGSVEVIKMTTNYINKKHILNGNKYITGCFLSDIVEDSKSGSLILEANLGNLELMETMAALNANAHLFDENNAYLGSILVINPYHGEGKTATNKELFYNFNLLAKLNKNFGVNNFIIDEAGHSQRIKMLTTIELARNELYYLVDRSIPKVRLSMRDIKRDDAFKERMLAQQRKDRMASDFSGFDGLQTSLEAAINGGNLQEIRDELIKLNAKLEKEFKYLRTVQRGDYNEEQKPERKLQRLIFEAISEIDGYDQRLQNKDDARYSEHLRNVLTKGHSGTYLDNQGFLSNPSLNRLAKATTIAYLNTRDRVLKVKNVMRESLQKLKEESHYDWVRTRIIRSNLTSMYHDMYDWSRTDDFMFVDPDTLSGAKKEYLEKALYIINRNRLIKDPKKRLDENYVKEYLNKIRYSEDLNERDKYFRVPLKPGSGRALAANSIGLHGLFNCLKDKLDSWNPKTIVENYKKKFEDFIDEEGMDQERNIKENALWRMVNRFNKSEGNYRLTYLQELGGPEACETNLEELVLEHTFAYAQQENIDEILPMIRATMMNVAVNEYTLNADFTQTFEYIAKYVRNKIFNQSLVSDEARSLKLIIGKVQSFTSKLALAFSPYQLYQHLDGIWKDISLYVRKPDGKTSFTFLNLKDSYFDVYSELIHFGDGNSLLEQLNEYYGINDMDMNSYVDKIKSDQSDFTALMFRMASRPDFYNRSVIFQSQMRGDGCWEAHSLVNGKMVYDFTKDKRFDLFANTSVEAAKHLSGELLEKYNSLKAMYLAMAELMVREKTRNQDGSLFEISYKNGYPAPLPKAYTTELSEGMKALGDMIYGYYSHEKKSLWQSTTIGSLVMLMNTYWSSKKNQYLAPGGIKYMGRMELYAEPKRDENGNIMVDAEGNQVTTKYWQVVDANGKVLDVVTDEQREADPELKAKTIPLMRWKGQFQEGIFVTLFGMYKYFRTGTTKNSPLGKFMETWDYYWNHPDENLRRTYQANLHLLWMDMVGMILIGFMIGPWLEDSAAKHAKENGNEKFEDALGNSALAIGAHIVATSGADFNPFKSILGLGVNWTPFSVSMLTRVTDNVFAAVRGDKSFYDAVVNSAAALRSSKPMWDYIKGDADWGKSRNLIARENGELDE